MAFCFELFLEKFKDFTYFKYKEICDITSDGLIISKILDNAAELFYKDNIGYVEKNIKLFEKYHILPRKERLFPLSVQISERIHFGRKIINENNLFRVNYSIDFYTITKDKIFKMAMFKIKKEEYEYNETNSRWIFVRTTKIIDDDSIKIYVTSLEQCKSLLNYFYEYDKNRKIMFR
jgi:hypothetical protein